MLAFFGQHRSGALIAPHMHSDGALRGRSRALGCVALIDKVQRHRMRTMHKVTRGIFPSYRDNHGALRSLRLTGLGRNDAYLYLAHWPGEVCAGAFLPTGTQVRRSDYAAHGEHWRACGQTVCYLSKVVTAALPIDKKRVMPVADAYACILLLANETTVLKLSVAGATLHEYGAIAVPDPSAQWRFSPYWASEVLPRAHAAH